jgi:hypothetical protein
VDAAALDFDFATLMHTPLNRLPGNVKMSIARQQFIAHQQATAR